MNIKTKILVPSMVAMAMMLVLGIVSFFGMRVMQHAMDDVSNKGMQHIALLNGSRSELFAANVGAYRLFATMENLDPARVKTDTDSIVAHAGQAMQELEEESRVLQTAVARFEV